MSVTLQIKGDPTSSITLNFKTISIDKTSSKMKVGGGVGTPYYIKFGFEESITASGQIFSSADYIKLNSWTGDVILECTATSYPEIKLTASTYYIIIDKNKLSRKGGYLDMWDFSLTLIQDKLTKLKRWS